MEKHPNVVYSLETKQRKGTFSKQCKMKNASNLKVKTKSHRPIILLRRNSCGSISSRSNPLKTKASLKMPRLKSMTEIEGNHKSGLQNIFDNVEGPKVKTEAIPEISSFEAINQCNGHSIAISSMHCNNIKTEVVENFTPSTWSGELNRQNFIKNHLVGSSPQPDLLQQSKTSQLCDVGDNKSLMSDATFINSAPATFLKQKPVPFHQYNMSPFCGNQQLQNIRPLSVPVNDGSLNTFVPDLQEQVPLVSSLQCQSRFAFPPVSPNQNSSLGNFYHSNIPSALAPPGTMIQQISNPEIFQDPTVAIRQNSSQNIQLKAYNVRPKYGESVVDDSLTNITWLGRMGVNNFMPVPLERERKPMERNDKRGRPPYSYMALIQFAINSSSSGRMTLRQIYQWIEEKFPYFKTAKPGWKNSIRHNLSLHDIFVREVTSGSKASYWTLRADLNIRPLTLDSVDASSQGPVWSLQTCGQGQKPLLPRLPQCSRPYILLPVPLLQSNNQSSLAQSSNNRRVSECSDNFSSDLTSSSSILADSGFNSDMSQCTPGTSSQKFSFFSPRTGSILQNDNRSSTLKANSTNSDPSPLLSQSNVISGTTSKRSRKEPLKTLNDSLNSSLQFLKNEPHSPPQRRRLSPSGEQFLLCKKMTKKPKKKDVLELPSKATAVGLSDESFSELLNDLGSPFKTYFSQAAGSALNLSPQAVSARKRRRSWGSPESSSSGAELQTRLRAVNETTPVSQQIRRVKSEAADLSKSAESSEHYWPTSTPLSKNKWQTQSHGRSRNEMKYEDEENINPENLTPIKKRGGKNISSLLSIPSPIPSRDADLENAFFQDIIGSVFKTPDRPSAPVQHFDSLTPERVPFTDDTSKYINNTESNSEPSGCASSSNLQLRGFSCLTPSKEEPLNTSFSKLLDISGGSGSFSRISSHLPDLPDLNLSWSNLSHF